MNGSEHYRQAERLLALAGASKQTSYEGENPEADRDIAAAQVHATLALAAATAMAAPVDDEIAGFTVEDREAWYAAAGTKSVPRGDAG